MRFAKKSNQKGFLNLLFLFKTNLNTLNTEIVSKKASPTTIDTIIGHDTTLKNDKLTQQTYIVTRKEFTNEAINAFNQIDDSLIIIGKSSRNFYKTNKTKQQLFSFAIVTDNLNDQSTKNNKTK